ncbi:MAG: ComEC/Rec2 family competence protein, partial [Hyphomonadaceae bacterium]
EETQDALRNSGLGHLLSVSGLHMSVVGGLMFGALALLASLIAPLALRVSARKIAAAGALMTLSVYLVVSGASVPAQRAYVMAAVAFGAVLIDRPAITMRGLGLSILIVVLAFPESVLEPGFQMSFAATAALVAIVEAMRRPPEERALPTPGPLIGALQALTRVGAAMLAASLVAGIATEPFALFHFQRLALYGLASNLAVDPIVTFVVAPTAALAAVAAPFGLAEGPLQVMAGGLDVIAGVGQAFGDRPEAVRALLRPPDLFLPLAAMAIAWACLWRGALRWGALGWAAAAVALYALQPRPVLAFDGDLRALFIRTDHDWALAAGPGRSSFARERLGGQLGISAPRLARLAPPEGCADEGCRTRLPDGRALLLARTPRALSAACAPGALVLTPLAAPADFAVRCRPAALIDAVSLAAEGGGFVFVSQGALSAIRAAPPHARRPWTVYRPQTPPPHM